ncbi:LysR family transcriptional regulator [Arthrobacter sp. JSM 101049]|uniref:LysR family transcriptional regulator n=1 Tax=Arthrobacter sp. JSM 101049 TaxID=929097 RepID=UPI00356B24B0
MLEVRRLRLLREMSIRGTIAGVAAALNYSPSAVSQQLALLEKETGVVLLRRSGRRLALTPQAQVLVAHTTELLESLERAEAALASTLPETSGTVRLAMFQSAALALLPGALARLRADHPGVRVEMTQHEPETALHETWARDFDLVVAEQYPGHAMPRYPGLDRRPLVLDSIRLGVADPELLGLYVESLEQAARLPWVMEPRGTASRHWAEQLCRSTGFEPDVRYESADLQAHIALVESGNAVALLPDLVWAHRNPQLRSIEVPSRPWRTVFTAARESSTQNPVIAAVRSALETQADGLAENSPNVVTNM